MNDSLAMAVVESGGKLQHDFCHLTLRHLSFWKALPVLVKFSTCEVLHHHDQLLLICLWYRIDELDNVFVLEASQRLNFFLDHLVTQLPARKIQCLDCYFLPRELIEAHVDLTETTFAQIFLEFQRIHTHGMIKIVIKRVEKTFLLE